MLRVPQYLDNQLTDGGKVVSLTRRPPKFLLDIKKVLHSDSICLEIREFCFIETEYEILFSSQQFKM
jgi:hypothetical protein